MSIFSIAVTQHELSGRIREYEQIPYTLSHSTSRRSMSATWRRPRRRGVGGEDGEMVGTLCCVLLTLLTVLTRVVASNIGTCSFYVLSPSQVSAASDSHSILGTSCIPFCGILHILVV